MTPPAPLPYEIFPYSTDKFLELLADRAEVPKSRVALKMQIEYFNSYFSYSDINAKTIIVENDYIDKDYLQDFAEYYLACFKKYNKTCTRLHFFDVEITKDDFLLAVRGHKPGFNSYLQEHYLGFIVLKPLPETIIGRTCLKVYDTDGGRRNYLGIKKNWACLFGFKLYIHSLPFQEQDKAVAACATSALWSVFHATGDIFHHVIPSPSAITKQAFQNAPIDTRCIPNGEHGLNPLGMATAIRAVGLEPLKLAVSNEYIFRGAIYAFLKCNIPVVLGFALVDYADPAKPVFQGKHAVAVTGYSIPVASSLTPSGLGIAVKSLCMDKIYVHDDQIGPFSRMTLDATPSSFDGKNYFSLTTTWRSQDGTSKKVKAFPEIIVVPLYHKIRIPFMKLFTMMIEFGRFLETIRKGSGVYPSQFEWDLFLTNTTDVKTSWLSNGSLKDSKLQEALLRPLPRYLWKMTVSADNNTLADFIFDATDLEQGNYLTYATVYEDDFGKLIKATITNTKFPPAATIISDYFSCL